MKLSFRDFFRAPELTLLLMVAVMPFGWWAVMLLISWVLHIWLRVRNGGRTSSGRKMQVVVTMVSWLMMLFLSLLVVSRAGADAGNGVSRGGLAGIVNAWVGIMEFAADNWFFFLMIKLFSGIFFAAQLVFWVSGIWRLLERRLVRRVVK